MQKTTIRERFEYMQGLTSDDTSASILVLADVIDQQLENIDQQLCLGIRMGLFGINASNDSSIPTGSQVESLAGQIIDEIGGKVI